MPDFMQIGRPHGGLANIGDDTTVESFQFVHDFTDNIISNFTDTEQNEILFIILDRVKINRKQRIEETSMKINYIQKEYNNLIDMLLKHTDEPKDQMKRPV